MALADVLNRIADDAAAEVGRLESAAREQSEALVAAAETSAAERAERTVRAAHRNAESEASARVATARLASRDAALSGKHEVLAEAIAAVVSTIESLPAERYARFLGEAIVAAVRDGDSVSLAEADVGAADAVRATVAELAGAVSLEWSPEPAPVRRGALVKGARTHMDITPESIVAERRAELELGMAPALFGQEGA